MWQYAPSHNGMSDVHRLRRVEQRHSGRRPFRSRCYHSRLPNILLLRLRLTLLVAVRGVSLANGLAIPTSALDPRKLRGRINGRGNPLQHARSSVRFGR